MLSLYCAGSKPLLSQFELADIETTIRTLREITARAEQEFASPAT
jgi:hypothetical protein